MKDQAPTPGSNDANDDGPTIAGGAVVTRLRTRGARSDGREPPGGGADESAEVRVDLVSRALAERFRQGDPAALGEVFDSYAGAVYSMVLSVLGDRSLADDAVQETFLRAWRAADRFDSGKPMSPWLFTIARRTAIDVHRREMRPTRGDHAAEQEVVVDLPGIESSWQRWEIQRALAQLDPAEQELMKLSHFYGFTQSQIASRLGLAIGTVKSRSYRVHRRLAALLRHLDSAGVDHARS